MTEPIEEKNYKEADDHFIEQVQVSPEEQEARKRRNMWLGWALFGFVVLVMVITMIRLYTALGVSERM